MIESHIYVDSRENCVVSNRCPEHDTLRLTIISLNWDSPKVK